MRKLAVLSVIAAAVPLAATGAFAALPPDPQIAADNAANAASTALSNGSAAAILRHGGLRFQFDTNVSGGFRLVLRALNPRTGAFVTIENELRHVEKCPPGTTNQTYCTSGRVEDDGRLSSRGRKLLKGNRSSLTVFVIAHIRPDISHVSAESIQIVTLPR